MNIDLLTVDASRTEVLEKQTTALALADASCEKSKPKTQRSAPFWSCARRAQQKAKGIDALADKGDALPPLAGVPIAMKDVLTTKGVRTTAGSKILDELHRSLRCDGGGAAGSGRRDRPGQDELRRVRHGLVERELRFPSGAQPARPDTRAGRIVGWIGGGGCGGNGGGLARDPTPAARFASRRRSAAWSD